MTCRGQIEAYDSKTSSGFREKIVNWSLMLPFLTGIGSWYQMISMQDKKRPVCHKYGKK
jgi:hypothetical protein